MATVAENHCGIYLGTDSTINKELWPKQIGETGNLGVEKGAEAALALTNDG